MDALLHFFKHLIGLCGEAHPSLIMGGGVFKEFIIMEMFINVLVIMAMAWVISR